MKVFLGVFFCLLVVGSTVGQQTADCSLTNNAFLKWLSAMDSTLVRATADTTTSPFPVCNELWRTTGKVGTCCDTTKINATFQKRIGNSKANWGLFMSTLHRLRRNLAKINKVIGNDVDTQLDSMRGDNKFDLMGLTNIQIKSILDIAANFETRLTNFKTDAKPCFKSQVSIAGKAFCNGCWAFGGSNWVANGDGTSVAPNFKMTPTSCNTLAQTCGSSWKFMFDAQILMNFVSQLSKKKFNVNQPPANDKNIFNKVSLALNTVKVSFDNCHLLLYIVSNACTQTDIQTLCSAFYSWAGNSKLTREVKEEAAQGAVTARLLQASTPDDSSSVFDAAGADLTATITTPTADDNIDTNTAGDAPTSFSRIGAVTMVLFSMLLATFF